jgi:polyadenylate-binding protein
MNEIPPQNQLGKTVLFISELPDNILDTELEDFFSDFRDNILMIQIDRNSKIYDPFNVRKPKATIIFKDHDKADEARNTLNMKRLKGKALNIMWHEKDNSIRYNNTANIFVKGIPPEIKPREVFELFNKYGEIISVKICEDEDGNLLGYGYINYYSLDSAENAIKELNKKNIWGSVLEIEHFQKKNERLQSNLGNNSIYIKNIPDKINESEIKDLFKKFGEITWSKVLSDNSGRKFAIIVFSSSESASKAKEEMNDKKLDNNEIGLYVDLLQKKSERKRFLISKIGDINNKLNQEFKNCNLYIKNLPYDLTEEKLKEIFEKYGEVKSVKISKFILVTKIKDELKEIEQSRGFGYVCYTNPESATKAIEDLNEKNLPGYENAKRPVIISLFMPKYERKQFLNKLQSNPMSRFPLIMGLPYNIMPPMIPNGNYNQRYRNNYNRKNKKQNNYNTNNNNSNNNNNVHNNINHTNNKEDELNLSYLESLENDEAKKEYLGEFLFKKIESHPLAHKKNFTIDIIGRITGMILGIQDIKEIYDITVNDDILTSRINEALNLLESQ